MKDDCYGTCPKCGETGWCHYKGKARIFKSGPGSGTYKVSLFKCRNCGKKFGFELENGVLKMKNKERDDNEDWKEIMEILRRALHSYDDNDTIAATRSIARAYSIAAKHCRCDS